MPKKTQGLHNRWFIEAPLYQLANGEEIRQAARKAGVRLIDARYKTEFDAEAPGKPAEVLHDRYKKQGGSSDSNHPAPNYPEGQDPKVKMAEQRLTELHAAEVAEAQTKAEDAESKAQVAVDNADGKAAAAKAAAEAAAKAAKAKAEAEANKSIEAKAEVAEKAVK